MQQEETVISIEKLKKLLKVLDQADEVLILPHNNPDPDAIASAIALHHLVTQKLNLKVHVAYQGIIGRAENRALVRYLEHPLKRVTELALSQMPPIALVDTQPKTGNITLPPQSGVVIVIDHHDHCGNTAADIPFTDIRPDFGATSTILTEYLQTANLEPASPLATALFYGIKANTMGLGRDVSQADAAAYFYLQSRIDAEALAEIERAEVSPTYFKSFDAALQAARIYNSTVICYLESIAYPDLTAEIADLLLRLEESQWVICMGVHNGVLFLSVRSRNRQGGAGRLVRAIIKDDGSSGGHGTMAGGQISVVDRDLQELIGLLSQRALQYLNVPSTIEGKPLV
jgi:nanoRNase/pAp phosphatase (c-di-AMP/oligoRNAs hydrolase)